MLSFAIDFCLPKMVFAATCESTRESTRNGNSGDSSEPTERTLLDLDQKSPPLLPDDVNRGAEGCTGSACVERAERPNDDTKVIEWEC